MELGLRGRETDLGRVTVVTPSRWADVALPADIPLVDLLPALVHHVGDDDLIDRPVVLQRLGEPPLNDESSVAALGLVDGETLHLRAVDDQLPPIEFDDLVDGVAIGIRDRPNRWKPQLTRGLFLGLATVPVAVAMLVLLLPGPAATRALLATALAAVLVLIASVLSRKLDDITAAAVSGCAAQPLALLAGLLAPAPAAGGDLASLSSAPQNLATAGAALVVSALLSWLLIGSSGPAFVGMMIFGMFTCLGCLLVLVGGLPVAQASAVVLAGAVLLGQFLPANAYRLAGMRVPSIPTGPADLNSDIKPLPGEPLLTRVALADRYFTALTCAVSVVAAGAVLVAARSAGTATTVLILVCSTALLLRSRLLLGRAQRIATLAAGLVGFPVVFVAAAASTQLGGRLILIALLVLLMLLALAGARVLPQRRLPPHFARAADVLETLTAVSILPILFAVLGIYAFARALGS